MIRIRIVTSEEGAPMGLLAKDFDNFDEVEAAGYERDGERCGGQHLLEHLRGQPCLKGLCGPMHDEERDADGRPTGQPMLRYEDWPAYDRLSR